MCFNLTYIHKVRLSKFGRLSAARPRRFGFRPDRPPGNSGSSASSGRRPRRRWRSGRRKQPPSQVSTLPSHSPWESRRLVDNASGFCKQMPAAHGRHSADGCVGRRSTSDQQAQASVMEFTSKSRPLFSLTILMRAPRQICLARSSCRRCLGSGGLSAGTTRSPCANLDAVL